MLQKIKSFLLVLIFLAICVISPLSQAAPLKAGIDYTPNLYRIAPGDILSVQMLYQPDFSQAEVLVREDGNATFTGIGELHVAGATLMDLSQALEEQYAELMVSPKITVNITQPRPATIYVAGAVKNPGMIQLATSLPKNAVTTPTNTRVDLRLSNILTNAGGVMLNADLAHVQVKQAGSGQTISVNLWQMLKEGASDQDVWLQSGDSIYVPILNALAISDADYDLLLRSTIGPGTFPVRVIGEVNTPGLYDLNGQSATLASAIAKAGGYKPGARKSNIAIRRFHLNKPAETLVIDPNQDDLALRPNDVVYVAETGVARAGRFMETLAKVFTPFTQLGTTAFSFAWATGLNNNN